MLIRLFCLSAMFLLFVREVLLYCCEYTRYMRAVVFMIYEHFRMLILCVPDVNGSALCADSFMIAKVVYTSIHTYKTLRYTMVQRNCERTTAQIRLSWLV